MFPPRSFLLAHHFPNRTLRSNEPKAQTRGWISSTQHTVYCLEQWWREESTNFSLSLSLLFLLRVELLRPSFLDRSFHFLQNISTILCSWTQHNLLNISSLLEGKEERLILEALHLYWLWHFFLKIIHQHIFLTFSSQSDKTYIFNHSGNFFQGTKLNVLEVVCIQSIVRLWNDPRFWWEFPFFWSNCHSIRSNQFHSGDFFSWLFLLLFLLHFLIHFLIHFCLLSFIATA